MTAVSNNYRLPEPFFPLSLTSLQEEGKTALRDRDILKLKSLYKEASHRKVPFIEIKEVENFLISKVTSSTEKEQLVEWLLEVTGDKIADAVIEKFFRRLVAEDPASPLVKMLIEKENRRIPEQAFRDAFRIAADLGSEQGLALVQWLYIHSKQKLGLQLIDEVFQSCAWRKEALCIVRWLLDQKVNIRQECLMKAMFGCLYLDLWESFSILKAIWKKIDKEALPGFYKVYINILLSGVQQKLRYEVLDWFLEQAFLLQGSRGHVRFSKAIPIPFNKQSLVEEINAHLRKKGFEWKYIRDGRIKATFRPLFEKPGPKGLAFFEQSCKKMGDELSPFSIKWAFIKAAVNGVEGLPLMEWLLEHRFEKLSNCTLQRAKILAHQRNDSYTAEWIEAERCKRYGTNLNITDESDLQLLLATCSEPNSYRPLGDMPSRFGWKPLTSEELDSMGQSSLEQDNAQDPFEKYSVTYQGDDRELFTRFYQKIREGKTPIQIQGSLAFKEAMDKILCEMSAAPSGRWALLFACRMKKPLFIMEQKNEKETSYTISGLNRIYLNIKSSCYVCTKKQNGNQIYVLHPLDSIFFHELMHILHLTYDLNFCRILALMPSADLEYNNLSEQWVISGGIFAYEKNDWPLLALTENGYNCEKGYRQRYGHDGRQEIDRSAL